MLCIAGLALNYVKPSETYELIYAYQSRGN
jgi:hypothetical protein